MGVGRTSSTGLPWLVASSDLTNGSDIIYPTSVAGTGVTLLGGQVSFSAATSVSVNGCFSETYRNYRLIIELTASSANTTQSIRFRALGTDNSNNEYWANRIYAQSSTVASSGLTTATSAIRFLEFETGVSHAVMDIFSPFATQNTAITCLSEYRYTSFYQHSQISTGQMTVTTSYDGFTIINNTGNITGTLRIYGMRNY